MPTIKTPPLLAVSSLLTVMASLAGADLPNSKSMEEGLATGITVAKLMQDRLKQQAAPKYPGITVWNKDKGLMIEKLDEKQPGTAWRKLDSNQLVTQNADFWQLYYEIPPGDPGLALLHAGALMSAGDSRRAAIVVRLYLYRGDLPEDTEKILISAMQHFDHFGEDSNKLVKLGVELFDQGKLPEAMVKYDAALKLWPKNGWASYERGFTFRMQHSELKEGLHLKEFAVSRASDPFQFAAWQGTIKDIPGIKVMHSVVEPIWRESLKSLKYVPEDKALEELSSALQEAKIDDLALVVRQIYIVRRGRYLPDDHPFIAKSLRRLVPGGQAERTIKKLSGKPGAESFETIQLMDAPTPGKVPTEGIPKQG